MAKTIAVILSGCGRGDGSEIHESVLTLLAIARMGARAACLAPDIMQRQVLNHLTDQVDINEQRNVLVESARIARGEIQNIRDADFSQLDAAIYPGGFGAALNLSDFATKAADCEIQSDVLAFAKHMANAHKPQGFICIAPVMISKIYGAGVLHTIGNDNNTARAINSMGGIHQDCAVDEMILDTKHKVVSSPAYMLAKSITEVEAGITKLVRAVIEMI